MLKILSKDEIISELKRRAEAKADVAELESELAQLEHEKSTVESGMYSTSGMAALATMTADPAILKIDKRIEAKKQQLADARLPISTPPPTAVHGFDDSLAFITGNGIPESAALETVSMKFAELIEYAMLLRGIAQGKSNRADLEAAQRKLGVSITDAAADEGAHHRIVTYEKMATPAATIAGWKNEAVKVQRELDAIEQKAAPLRSKIVELKQQATNAEHNNEKIPQMITTVVDQRPGAFGVLRLRPQLRR